MNSIILIQQLFQLLITFIILDEFCVQFCLILLEEHITNVFVTVRELIQNLLKITVRKLQSSHHFGQSKVM